MWCYSLRFPRIRKIKINQTFMECITFQELQELGRDSISTIPRDDIVIDESHTIKQIQKRVRFITEESSKMLKSEFYVYLSKRIRLSERDKLTEWFEYRGFELIWSLEALKMYGGERKVVFVSASTEDYSEDFKMRINYESVSKMIKVEGAYFILDQGIKT